MSQTSKQVKIRLKRVLKDAEEFLIEIVLDMLGKQRAEIHKQPIYEILESEANVQSNRRLRAQLRPCRPTRIAQVAFPEPRH